MCTANQAKDTLNETLLQTNAAQNKKIDNLFQMVAAQANATPPTKNKTIVPPTVRHERDKHKCPT